MNIMIALNVREKGEGSIPHGDIPDNRIRRVKKGINDPIIII
jgi:hypothetical protein